MASKNNSVKNAVWIGASLLAYGEYIYLKSNNLRISSNSFWIKQSELLRFSQEFSKNTIQNARVNQWYSGDHSNSSYNYLRSNGILRRVTAVGEFNLNKELPIDLSLNDLCQYEYKGISIKITISDLIQWIKDVYSKYIFAEKGKTSKPTERELPQSEVTDNNDNKKIEESMIIVRQPQSTGSNKNLDICQYIHQFMGAVKNNEVEVYNEFSLQHELGIYLRSILDK
ncbi:MAG: hypothetical protein F8N39_18070 [Clostridiaceae bacterium]|nr:hypothetical protein [Clostridiaceae bacterium]